ncbi:MAG: STAS domain-containing protein [Ruminococcaceae bacterium]|nr:STAS domain-containing protein [Oscillospiraceae bacterium]
MAKSSCKLNVSCINGILTASLCGELDHHGAVAVRTLIDGEIQRQNPQKTVLDLTGLDFMDSSGLGLIMGRYALMQRLGGEFAVKNPNERVLKIFKLAGLERMVKVEAEPKRKEKVK